jgi:D-alanine-D-alanine ligase
MDSKQTDFKLTQALDYLSSKKIVVLMGGDSAEREISLKSGQSVIDAFQSLELDVTGLDVRFGPNLIQDLEGFEYAFIALHGPGGEDGQIQGLLELLEIPYSGSGPAASAIAMDKMLTKAIWKGEGLPMPEAAQAGDLEEAMQAYELLGPKVMVKPSLEGSSMGVALVKTPEELEEAFNQASKLEGDVLIESFLEGGEYGCAVLAGKPMPCVKVVPTGEFYDYEAKYVRGDTQYLIPCGLSEAQEAEAKALSVKALETLGCEAWGRVDFFVTDNRIDLIEVNTIPGMTPTSLFPKMAGAHGLSFGEMLLGVVGAKV